MPIRIVFICKKSGGKSAAALLIIYRSVYDACGALFFSAVSDPTLPR